MATIQTAIDNILLDRALPREGKIERLRALFEREDIRLFSDFDDTIVAPATALHSLYRLARAFGKILGRRETAEETADLLLRKLFRPNPDFADLLGRENLSGKLVILTRNSHALIRRFVESERDRGEKRLPAGVDLVGAIGRKSGTFSYSSREKLDFLPDGAILIADTLEHPSVRNSDRTRLVDDRSAFRNALFRLSKIPKIIASLARLARG